MKDVFHGNSTVLGLRLRHYLACCSFATMAIAALPSCGTTAQEIQAKQDEPSEVEILYNSILQEYRARSLPIALSSPERLIVASGFVEFEPGKRRRYVSRILPMPNGIALNVSAEYQRLDESVTPPGWEMAEDEKTLERAAGDEANLGAGIQKQFAKNNP